MSDNHFRTGSGFATRAVHVGNEVGRDSGAIFGPAGEGFQRINVACPRTTLEQALEQLKRAIRGA